MAFLRDFLSNEKKSQSYWKKKPMRFSKKVGDKKPMRFSQKVGDKNPMALKNPEISGNPNMKNCSNGKKKLKIKKVKNHYSPCSLVLLLQKAFSRPEIFTKCFRPCFNAWGLSQKFRGFFIRNFSLGIFSESNPKNPGIWDPRKIPSQSNLW